MKKYHIGIDSGSTSCKAILFDGLSIVDKYISKSGWNVVETAKNALSYLLKNNGISGDEVHITSTGYGREAIDFANSSLTEITCHAFGASYIAPDAVGIIDIGGQDSKVIRLFNGKVENFLMNDKCAAGTGRFLNMACDSLGIDIERIDEFTDLNEPVFINSMCTVFAESEIIGALAMQKERKKILAGVIFAIANKVKQMSGKLDFKIGSTILMTGGLSRSNTLVDVLSTVTELKIVSHELSVFAGAIGASIFAATNYTKE